MKIDVAGEVKLIPIDDIKPYENNPRINDKSIEEVKKSIKHYGFNQPIGVDKDMIIVVGHTRYEASKRLGLKEVPVVILDHLNGNGAKGYRLADNKAGENSIWDNKKLLEELKGLDDSVYTGFVESDIFEDILDEKDNEPLENNREGVTYSLNFTTQNEGVFERVRDFILEVADVE